MSRPINPPWTSITRLLIGAVPAALAVALAVLVSRGPSPEGRIPPPRAMPPDPPVLLDEVVVTAPRRPESPR